MLKGLGGNSGDGVGYGEASQSAAVRKRLDTNGGDTVADANAGQAAATRKCIGPDAGDAGRNGDGSGFTTRALDEGGYELVIQNPIYAAVICIGCTHANAGQAVATPKSIYPYAGDARRDADAGQAAAISKRISPNGRMVIKKYVPTP